MKVIDHPSPNFEPRKAEPLDMVIIHYTDMRPCEAALERLCDPGAKVSAHYMIRKEGEVYKLVDEEMRAWHAGVSEWDGRMDINSHSIGIELDHCPDDGAFETKQIDALIELLRDIKTRHAINPAYVLGHDEVAPERKRDPGPYFPWCRLEKEGLVKLDNRPVIERYKQQMSEGQMAAP